MIVPRLSQLRWLADLADPAESPTISVAAPSNCRINVSSCDRPSRARTARCWWDDRPSRARTARCWWGANPHQTLGFERSRLILRCECYRAIAGISDMSRTRLAQRDIRSVRHAGKQTSVSLELPIWETFCIIANERGVSIGELLDYVNRTHRLEPTITGKQSVRNLSSAVRMFVMSQCVLKPQPKPNPRIKWVK